MVKLLSVVALGAFLVLLIVAYVPRKSAKDPWRNYLAPTSACPNSDIPLLSSERQIRSMRCLINWAREKKRLSPIKWSPILKHSSDLKLKLLLKCDQFSHIPCGRPFVSVFKDAGFGRGAKVYGIGENLGYGQAAAGSPRQIVDNWLNSPEHRQNLFDYRWRLGGLALARPQIYLGYRGIELWVSQFGYIQSS